MLKVSDVTHEIVSMKKSGMKQVSIAGKLGLSVTTVANHVRSARACGLLEKRTPKDMKSHFDNVMYMSGIRRGRIQDVFTTMPEEITNWLIDETVKGTTVAQTIASIVIDTYHEEKQKD